MPPPRSPPITCAVKKRTPSARLQRTSQGPREKRRLVCLDSGTAICMKYLLNRFAEEARQRDREGQGRRVALDLDRVDRLARDVHLLRQLLLGEAAFGAQSSDLVPHSLCKASLTSLGCQVCFTSRFASLTSRSANECESPALHGKGHSAARYLVGDVGVRRKRPPGASRRSSGSPRSA